MKTIALQTDRLTKTFRTRRAVFDLSLEVETGQVFGFVGPNGAGKTTTIRMLLGLSRPSSGKAFLLDTEVPRDLKLVRFRIGALLESAGFYPTISARHNLRLLGLSSGARAALGRVDFLLERVGLLARADEEVRKFSHGMRQRLGLAAALLHDPELLIMDEPHTGLDPTGMIDFRDLIVGLGREGKTVFFSSHVLSEVEEACTEVAFLSKGELVGQFNTEALRQRSRAVRVVIEDGTRAAEALTRQGWGVSKEGSDLLVEGASRDEVRDLLIRSGLEPVEVATLGRSLEQLYLDLVGGEAG